MAADHDAYRDYKLNAAPYIRGQSVSHPSLPGIALVIKEVRSLGYRQSCTVAWLESGNTQEAEFWGEELSRAP